MAMILRALLAAVLWVAPVPYLCFSGAAWAETAAGESAAATVEALAATLKIAELIDLLRDEGLAYAETLDEDLFPDRGGADWVAKAQAVYNRDAMQARFLSALGGALQDDPDTMAASEVFFASPLGQRILVLELEARRALMDSDVEEAARARVDAMRDSDDPRLAELQRFVEANDLIEANVQGALNANLAFYQGMVEAGGLGGAVDEQQMLEDVWGQEGDVRAETELWLYAYLAMAYSALSPDEMQAYIDFSVSAPGQRLNAALFAAFDAVFVNLSRNLGRAAALQMQGQDI
jgi:hypothetical protein